MSDNFDFLNSAVLNSNSRCYSALKEAWLTEYEDNVWVEDAIFLERNSRDFCSRVSRINKNAELICKSLMSHPSGMCNYLNDICSKLNEVAFQ